ncbi:hypothetical protein D3C73_985450 [compost metagenome]
MPPVLQQRLARGRKQRAMAGAVEQQHVQPILQLAYRIGYGRGHLAQFASGFGKAAVAGDGIYQDEQFRRNGLHVRSKSWHSKYLNELVKI